MHIWRNCVLIIQYLGASDCKLQEGSMRADVNLSVREVGADEFGTRTEMKNLNSFKAIAQSHRGRAGAPDRAAGSQERKLIQETRRWDDNKESFLCNAFQRRCTGLPLLPGIRILFRLYISDEWIERVKAAQPELRDREISSVTRKSLIFRNMMQKSLQNLNIWQIFLKRQLRYVEKPKKVSNWLMVETMRLLKEHNMEPEDIPFYTGESGKADRACRCRNNQQLGGERSF